MHIRPGRPGDAGLLSELAVRSKGYWGYDEAVLEACREELRLPPEDIVRLRVSVAEDDRGVVLGFYALGGETDADAEVRLFFVDPPAIRTGVGAKLFRHLVETAKAAGLAQFRIDADPGAAGFYERMGAVRIGEATSQSIRGRFLPSYRFEIRS